MNRRSFLCGAALATSAILPASSVAADRGAELTAIPTEVVEKIKAWQEAHRAATAASKAYSATLRAVPLNKADCDRCYQALKSTDVKVAPAREAMIMALWRV